MLKIGKFITGKISIHPRGFGFVGSTQKGHAEVFIPADSTKGAIDGDTVQVQVTSRSKKGYEGKVVDVIERGRTLLVGTIIDVLKNGAGVVFAASAGEDKEIVLKKPSDRKWKIGDRISMSTSTKAGGSSSKEPTWKLHEFFGNIDEPLIDTSVCVKEFRLHDLFPNEVEKEANSFKGKKILSEGRRDLTNLECITIDPEDAKDFDDAISIEKTKDGYRLGVHIADVSFFVTEGSNIDKEAFKRGNSTYFIDKVLPMLPFELSNDLCSLKEGVDRLTASALMDFDINGEISSYEICRSVIRSRKRFSYTEAKEVLDGKKESKHLDSLNLFIELYEILRKSRRSRGSVDLSLPEIKLELGDDGIPKGQRIIEYDITHRIIEEFMVKANEVVATHLIKHQLGGIFRVHEEPSEEKLELFFAYARMLGLETNRNPSGKDIQSIFQQAQKLPILDQLSLKYIRSMKLACYSSNNIGHYGLALEKYVHFTSPIRRYPDLVIHRLLFEKNYKAKLEEISQHTSERERLSFKAESDLLKLKKLRYLDKLTDKDPDIKFDAHITDLAPIGISFDIDFIGLDGFIHISELGNDHFVFNKKRALLSGTHTGLTYKLGQKISVFLETINLIFRECTWVL